ncbi:MAG: GNAT family N-acetyltransferase [Pseudanabaena frigida]|uniref:GNAT family N-acetyltransferase n=1 Tax=Pseudanabaena frigida TaxID=945775 RepID=A0A2W4VZY2_9CYAN|nr:MAG: GNAT family N-acetyltransferase [Pseudanabaena frigida]
MKLIRPTEEHLPSLTAALEQGWSPNNTRDVSQEELEAVRQNPSLYLENLIDREAKGNPITLPDRSIVLRLPGYRLWLWDGNFCGIIGFRWQHCTPDLPPYCLGHIGYAVVPWKRRRGYATQALQQLLPIVKLEGLPYVEITTDPDNYPSRRVIEANGGILVGEFIKAAVYGGSTSLRYRIFTDNIQPKALDGLGI